MRCRDIQRRIVDPPEGRRSEEESAKMKRHLKECRKCARFLEEHEKVRSFVRTRFPLVPPEELAVRTRTLCLVRLKEGERAADVAADGARRRGLPGYVYAALVVLIGLTLAFMAPPLKELELDQPFTLRMVMILILIVQNAAMLFFTPLILCRPRVVILKLEHKKNYVLA